MKARSQNKPRFQPQLRSKPLAQDGTSSANGDGISDAEGDNFGADDDTSALPPDVVDTTASVGIADDGKRVVINSDVVDALLQGKADTADTSAINNLVESTQAATELKTQTLEQTQVQNAQPKSVSFSFARDELKAMSPRSYTLQLAAMNSLQDVQGFIDEHKLQGKSTFTQHCVTMSSGLLSLWATIPPSKWRVMPQKNSLLRYKR